MGVTEQGQGDVNDKKGPPQCMRSLEVGGNEGLPVTTASIETQLRLTKRHSCVPSQGSLPPLGGRGIIHSQCIQVVMLPNTAAVIGQSYPLSQL